MTRGGRTKELTREYIEDRVMMLPDLPGCWLWTRACNAAGYGIMGVNKRAWLAHRASWSVFNGDPGDLCVLHKCDNPLCCNPDHLFLGTRVDNNNDKVRKGRQSRLYGERNGARRKPECIPRGERSGRRTKPWATARGERAGKAKLTADAVVAIRKSTEPNVVEAARHGVTPTLIAMIRRRKIWRHVA